MAAINKKTQGYRVNKHHAEAFILINTGPHFKTLHPTVIPFNFVRNIPSNFVRGNLSLFSDNQSRRKTLT